MTVTSPPARPARRRRWPAIAAAGAMLVLSALTGAPAAATTVPTPTPTDGVVDSGTVDAILAPVGNGVVGEGESLIVSVKVHNGTGAELPSGSITVSLGSRPLSSRAALSAWLESPVASVETTPVGETGYDPIAAGADRTRSLTIASEVIAEAEREPGVYPLVATVSGADEPVTATSVMIVADGDAAVVDTALIVPITAGPLSAGLLTSDQLAQMTASGGRLASQLDAVDTGSAILAVDPAILAAIRVLGDTAPQSALDWLTRLESLPNSRFALQFGDADPAVQLEAGLEAPASPRDLDVYADPDDFATPIAPTPLPSETDVPTPTPTPTPSPTATAGPEADDQEASAVPPLDALLAVRGAQPDVYWPASGITSPETVSQLGSLGSDDSTALTVLSSRATADGASGRAVSAAATSAGADLIVYDADVSQALSEAASVDDGVARSAALTAATAQLTFATAQTGGRPLAIAIDRAVDPTRAGISLAVSAIANAPGVNPVGLDDLLGGAAQTVTIADSITDPDRLVAASGLFSDEDDLERFATILEQPSLLTGPERAEVLQLLGTAWTADPVAAQAAVDAHRASTTRTLGSVALLPASDITLAGSTADLRFWVRNDLPYPVELVLYASSDSLKLSVQNAIPVTATASSNTRVVVPVEARVGSGEVALDLQLRSRTAVAIGPSEQVLVNVRAEWEGVGIIVMSVAVGILIVLGAVRTVLRLRARRRARATTDAGAGGSSESQDPDVGVAEADDAPAGDHE